MTVEEVKIDGEMGPCSGPVQVAPVDCGPSEQLVGAVERV